MNSWRSGVAGALVGAFLLGIGAGQTAASDVDQDVQMSVVGEAMEAVVLVKQSVASFRRTHDDFPVDNAQAGIPPPERFASNSVKRVAIGPEGVIDLTLTAASGVDGGMIRFHPDYVPQSGGGDVHWTCASASYSNIGDLTGGVCRYTNQP
jgi:hypothetical protein